MLKRQKTSQLLILPKLESKSYAEVSKKWKKAERRMTIISFPKIQSLRTKKKNEKVVYEDKMTKLPVINPTLESEIDYFDYYLKSEKVPSDELSELDKFTVFCEEDEKQEITTSKYFADKGREMLKTRQLETLKESDSSKQKELEAFKHLHEQTNIKNMEKSYYSLVEDFARLSFELCSLKSFEQLIGVPDNQKSIIESVETLQKYKDEITKEEVWIEKIEQVILDALQ